MAMCANAVLVCAKDLDRLVWLLRGLLGNSVHEPSSPTIVGFDVVNPVTARRKAGSMSMIATGFHHTGTPQVVT